MKGREHRVHIKNKENKDKKGKEWKFDDFKIGKSIGKGRFGSVYVAKEKKSSYVVGKSTHGLNAHFKDSGLRLIHSFAYAILNLLFSAENSVQETDP